MMDIKKLIEAARFCNPDADCDECPSMRYGSEYCMSPTQTLNKRRILALSNYFEAKLKAERAAVIAEVRDFTKARLNRIIKNVNRFDAGKVVVFNEILEKLDSMADNQLLEKIDELEKGEKK